MNKQTQAISHDINQLAEDARTLVNATADVAGEKVGQARDRLAAAIEQGKELYGRVRGKTFEGVRAADDVMHKHSYEAIAIGVGAGVILGYLIARQCACAPPRES